MLIDQPFAPALQSKVDPQFVCPENEINSLLRKFRKFPKKLWFLPGYFVVDSELVALTVHSLQGNDLIGFANFEECLIYIFDFGVKCRHPKK